MVNVIAELLIRCGAIEFGEFTLASGAKSKYYVDIKTAATNPEILKPIGDAIAATADFDVVAGVAVGAVPIAVAVSLSARKPYAIIRRDEKGHGKSGNIIGDVEGKEVLLVEDVTTTGGSVLYGIRCLQDAGARIRQVITVVDREEGAEATLRDLGIELTALVKASDILTQ